MTDYNFIGLKLGESTPKRIYLAYIEGSQKIFKNKKYFNKNTEQVSVYECKLANEFCNIIDENKKILLIKVLYLTTSFNTSKKIFKSKYFVYLDDVLHQTNRDIKRVPREIKNILNEVI